MAHSKLVAVKTDLGTAYIQPEAVQFIQPLQIGAPRCDVFLIAGGGQGNKAFTVTETADVIAQRLNAAMV